MAKRPSDAHVRLAVRIDHLGTETAYAVAMEAAKHAETGAHVYKMHLGDLNYPTPQVVVKAMNEAVAAGKTTYAPAAGILPLREALARHANKMIKGSRFKASNVSVQSGGKPVIGKFLACVMNPGDGVLFPSPGYPIYESQINYLEGITVPYTYVEGTDGFSLDMDSIRASLEDKSKNVRVMIVNNLNNPTGHVMSSAEVGELAQLACKYDLMVLSDDAYWDVVYDMPRRRHIGEFPGMEDRMMMLFTFSKSWAMTGWRLGAAIGPDWLVASVNRLNTNDEACTTHFVQYAGIQCLEHPDALHFAESMIEDLRARRDLLVRLVNEIPGFVAHTPHATFYLFVNVTKAMAAKNIDDVEVFRRHLLSETGVSVCTRQHFGTPQPQETQHYIRFAFSGVSIDDIQGACNALKKHFS